MLADDRRRVAQAPIDIVMQVDRGARWLRFDAEITARTGARLPEIFAAMFPSASITGAPKVRTMEIIVPRRSCQRLIARSASNCTHSASGMVYV